MERKIWEKDWIERDEENNDFRNVFGGRCGDL
jgi:hypothetical protein